MTRDLLDLPNEIIEIILFYLVKGTWKTDVKDFLSLTSTCRRLYEFCRYDRYWKYMALRRDPDTQELSCSSETWLNYCKQVYLMRTMLSDDLKNTVSRYNEDYFCTIEKVQLRPNNIRIFIDERGNNSLGYIQDPMDTRIAIKDKNEIKRYLVNGICPLRNHFTVADVTSQYLGYLDFELKMTSDHIGKVLIFEYGSSGYSNIILFEFDTSTLNKYNLLSLMNVNTI